MSEVAGFQRGAALTVNQARGGSVPVIANGPAAIAFHDESNRDGNFLVIARSGANAGSVSYWSGPAYLTDAFSVHPDPEQLSTRYALHLLRAQQHELHAMKAGGGVPHVRVREVQERIVVLPPLADQRRVAAELDEFEALVADLNSALLAELAARRKQYEYCRDRLLTFEDAAT